MSVSIKVEDCIELQQFLSRLRSNNKDENFQTDLERFDNILSNALNEINQLNNSSSKPQINGNKTNVTVDNKQDDESFISPNLKNTPPEPFILSQVFH